MWEELRSQGVDVLASLPAPVQTPGYLASKPGISLPALLPAQVVVNALHSLGIDLDVADYKEHALAATVGGSTAGKDVKAATYIECMVSGNPKEKVWGVGIHEDVVQASLIALLSAASSFLTSRVSTPKPFKPKHMRDFSQSEIHALEQLQLPASSSPLRSMTPRGVNGQGQVNFEKLEEAAWNEESQANGSH